MRQHRQQIESQIDDVPDMSNLLTAKMAKSKARAAYTALVDPAAMAMKAIAAAAKAVVTFLLTMRKRPVSHHDPALAAAHVLLLNRCDLSRRTHGGGASTHTHTHTPTIYNWMLYACMIGNGELQVRTSTTPRQNSYGTRVLACPDVYKHSSYFSFVRSLVRSFVRSLARARPPEGAR